MLGLVGAGLPIPRAAARLGLTRPAAEAAVRSAMAKLGVRTRTEAAVRAAG